MADTDDTDDSGSADADTGKTFTQAELDRIVAERVNRTKAQFADYADLKKKATAALSDTEKAVAEAKAAGAAEASAKTGARLARAEFRAAAAGKVPPDALDGFLEYADLTKFVGADGEPDEKAIAAAVKKLTGTAGGTNYDGGARTTAGKSTDMNAMIRRQAGYQ